MDAKSCRFVKNMLHINMRLACSLEVALEDADGTREALKMLLGFDFRHTIGLLML